MKRNLWTLLHLFNVTGHNFIRSIIIQLTNFATDDVLLLVNALAALLEHWVDA